MCTPPDSPLHCTYLNNSVMATINTGGNGITEVSDRRTSNGKNGVPHIPLPVSVEDLRDHHSDLSPSSTGSCKASRPLPSETEQAVSL